MRVLAFAGSFQKDSGNKQLVTLSANLLRKLSASIKVNEVDFDEFSTPHYDVELERHSGIPYGALRLARRLEEADAVLISTPESNQFIPSELKCTLDWSSRLIENPWKKKSVLLLSSSSSSHAGRRAAEQLRVCLKELNAKVIAESFHLAFADRAFRPDGLLKEIQETKALTRTLFHFVRHAKSLNCPVPANRLRSRLTYSVTLVWLVLSTFALPRCQFLCSGL